MPFQYSEIELKHAYLEIKSQDSNLLSTFNSEFLMGEANISRWDTISPEYTNEIRKTSQDKREPNRYSQFSVSAGVRLHEYVCNH